ncbi:MAG: tetratricopeptide repeat protein [Devosia sp.]
MTILPRLAAALGLAVILALGPIPAVAYTPTVSGTGAFLAGQQALQELRTADTVRFFATAVAEESDNPLVLRRAVVGFASNGDIEGAAQIARRLLKLDPNDQMARLITATEAMKQRRYAAAAEDLSNLGADSFEGVTGAILKAWALVATGRIDDGYALLDGLGEGGLEDFLLFHRSLMASVAGRQDVAISYASEAYDLEPFAPDIVEEYSRALGNAGRFGEAIDAIVGYEAQGLKHPLISVVKADLLANRRPGPMAANAQEGAANMFYTIGLAFAREGGNDVALVFMRLGSYLDPENDLINFGIGQLYDGAEQHLTANAIYEALPAASPLKSMAIVRIADNLDAMGNRTEAISRLSQIVADNPDDLDAVTVLGDLYRSDKQWLAAADTYTKALTITGGNTPGDWRLYYVRGITYERAKQWPTAEPDFLKALELNPNQPQVLNYLGYSWVDQGLNLDRALGLIQRAVAASPQDGYIIDSLGWAFYRLGRYDEAVTELERAVGLKPNDPEINDHLGDAYWRVGRKLEARFQWNVATSVDTEGNVKARAEPKLVSGLDGVPVDEDSKPIVEQPTTN